MMSPEQQHKEIEERLRAWLGEDRMGGVGPRRDYIAPELWPDLVAVWANAFHWFSALDAAEARAKAAEERVRELEAALEFSYVLACRGVERIDEENKTCGARLSAVHRQRLTIMCNQIRKHKDKWLSAKETPDAP